MILHRESDGREITVDPSRVLGTGGEATVYGVHEDAAMAAKVYHKPTSERVRKLLAMSANPPVDPMAPLGHCSIAWPVDLLRTPGRRQKTVGFLMPRVDDMSPIIDIYSPHTRLKERPWFNYGRLLRAAHNLATTVGAMHAGGYIVGDLNYTNVLVSGDALVTLIDTDSFQVPNPDGGPVYRCTVYTPEFTPPELQKGGGLKIDRSPEHDRFGLAALIFLLLMGGVHPFGGRLVGEGEPEPLAERISRGYFPYSVRRTVPYRPAKIAPPLEVLTPGLQQLFLACFEDGHVAPAVRPTAAAWQGALLEAEDSLVGCGMNPQHRYSGHLSACPWCERTAQLGGRDPFPSRHAVINAEHLKPVPVQPTLPEDWSPAWHFAPNRMFPKRPPPPATPVFNVRVWIGLVLALWVVGPAAFGIAFWAFPVVLPFLAAIGALFYGLAAACVPVALGMVGWRNAQAYAGGGFLMAVSAVGSVGGVALIGAIYFLSVL